MPCLELGCLAAEPTRRTRGLLEGPAYLLIYACEELHQYRVREVWPAREVAVARTAVRVGGVRQARERTLDAAVGVDPVGLSPSRALAFDFPIHGTDLILYR